MVGMMNHNQSQPIVVPEPPPPVGSEQVCQLVYDKLIFRFAIAM